MLLNLIYFVLVLGIIVLVHESGHFLFAKLCGIYVYEFSIGMGPKLFSKKGKNGETEYCIRAIPIGGFVSLAGEEVDDDKKIPEERKLYAKKAWQRFLVMFFGAGFNFIFAVLILFSIGLFYGAVSSKPIISEVVKDNPAAVAGLKDGDRVLAINNRKVKTSDDISLFLQIVDKSKPVKFKVERDGKEYTFDVNPIKEKVEDQDVYRIGVMINNEKTKGFGAAVEYAFVKTGALFRQMFITLESLFTGGVSINQFSGPVGIYNIVGTQAEAGFANILYLIALLSINVGFINLIPFPAFDGGRILFLIIEKIKGSPVKPETESKIHTIGFLLLMILMVYITFNDILRLF